MEELFRKFKSGVEVSNLGNVRKKGEPVELNHDEYYDYFCLKGKQYRVHRVVGELFQEICGKKIPYGHVHHKNHNQRDNRAENLIWLTASEHKRLHQLEDGVAKRVVAYKPNGDKVGEWASMTEAQNATGAHQTHIGRCLRGERYTAGGLIWAYSGSTEEEVTEKINQVKNNHQLFKLNNESGLTVNEYKKMMSQEKKKIFEYDDGKFIREWANVHEAADYYGVTTQAIACNLKHTTRYFKKGGKKKYFLREFMPN